MNRKQLESFQQVSAAFDGIESVFQLLLDFLGTRLPFRPDPPGIALYGGEAVIGQPKPMRPVVTAEASILQIREAKAGETVSYGATCQLARDSRLAVASVGYADGYLRNSFRAMARPCARQACGRPRLHRRPRVPVAGASPWT